MKQTSKFDSVVIVFVVLAALCVALAPHPAIAGSVGPVVDLVLLPATQTVNAGSTFDITIQAQCNGQDVLGVEVHANFEPAYLEVQSIIPGTTLSIPLSNTFNNAAGTIDYSAGTISQPYPSTNFTVATIKCISKNVSTSATATIRFSTTSPRKTLVDYGGTSVLRNAAQASVNIQGSGSTATTQATGSATGGASAGAPATIANAASSAVPFNNAADVPASSNIDIIFNQAMNTASVQSAFSISPAVKGSFIWTGNVMTFKPEASLAYGQAYTVTIGTGAQNAAGSRLASAYTLSFTTSSQAQPVPPPATSPANVPAKPSVSLAPPATPAQTPPMQTQPTPPPASSQRYFDPQSGLYFNSEAELKAYQAAHPQQKAPATAPAPVPRTDTSGTNWGLIIGIIVGVVVVLAILYYVFNDWIRRD